MIKGKSTFLRAIEYEDLNQLLEWRNNPELRKYFREYRELNRDQQIKWFEETVLKDNDAVMFSILNLDKKLIGACGLCHINWINRSAEFSIYIGHNGIYIDNDFTIDASRMIIKYAFEELSMHRLWAEIYNFDEQKVKMFDVLGFKLDGCHRETYWSKGKWHDSLFFSLLSDEK